MDLSVIITVLGSAAAIALGVGYGLASFRKGKMQADLDVLNIASAQTALLKITVQSLEGQVGILRADLSTARGQIDTLKHEVATLKQAAADIVISTAIIAKAALVAEALLQVGKYEAAEKK